MCSWTDKLLGHNEDLHIILYIGLVFANKHLRGVLVCPYLVSSLHVRDLLCIKIFCECIELSPCPL